MLLRMGFELDPMPVSVLSARPPRFQLPPPLAQENPHLDTAYGGYCVFAQVQEGDAASYATVDAIAAAIKGQGSVRINSVTVG